MIWTLITLALAGPSRRTPIVEAVERATPSVVALEVEVPNQSPFFFGGPERAQSQGSGVILRADGIVLTNAHVIEGALRITAHTLDGRSFEAQPIALDADLDLAVLRLEGAKDLVAIALADSEDLMLGETTIAIGNPYGLGLTVSTGVVASMARDVQIQQGVTQSYIQTDAAINPGNSGGALVNIEGALIGINTAIRDGAEGIGFAIPARRAQKIANDLLLYGSVRAPWLGCDFDDVQPRRLVGTPLADGALRVVAVHRGSPCEKAGIEQEDLVFAIDGRSTVTRSDLNAWLASKAPGDALMLKLAHERTIREVAVQTTALPTTAGRQALKRLGITVQPVQKTALIVMATDATGSWVASQLQKDDILLAVDGQRVSTEAALLEALAAAKARHQGSALFTVQRGRSRGHVAVRI